MSPVKNLLLLKSGERWGRRVGLALTTSWSTLQAILLWAEAMMVNFNCVIFPGLPLPLPSHSPFSCLGGIHLKSSPLKAQIIHFYAHLFYSKYEMVALSKPGLVLVKLRAYVAFRTIWWISTFIWQWTHKNKICWMKEKKFSPDILSSLRFFLK